MECRDAGTDVGQNVWTVFSLPPDLFGHITNVVGDKIVGFVVEKTLGKIGSLVTGVFDRHKAEAEKGGDPERLEIEVERLLETVASLQASIAHNAPNWNWDLASEEASEPAFAQFVDEAMDAAAASRVPSKRLMLGLLIARRLQVRTETVEELALRRALHVARDLTESQILLLAAALLVQRLPTDGVEHFGSRDAAEAWLREYCGSALEQLIARVPWDSDDFDVLASDGAILMDPKPRSEDEFGAQLDYVAHWLHVHGVSPYDGLDGEWGTKESHALYGARFPTIVNLNRLARNGTSDEPAQAFVSRHIADVPLTPLGVQLAYVVFDQLRAPNKADVRDISP